MTTPITRQATIQRLRIQNYRVLRDVEFRDLTPLTVLLGPNGSGKSTVFDEENGSPVVVGESLHWSISPGSGAPTDILSFPRGAGRLYDETRKIFIDEKLDSPDLLAVSTLGGPARHLRVAHLRRFISLRFKDAPFDEPVLAKYASDGTLKLLAYLTVLYDPAPPPIVAIEEPENFLHPRLLNVLAEEARLAAGRSQLLGNLCMEGYFEAGGGLAEVAAAAEIAQYMNVEVNRSRSLLVFRDGVRRLVAGGRDAEES
ncbi:MAG: AAA family ATPase [Pseudonocardiaceae bacterium]